MAPIRDTSRTSWDFLVGSKHRRQISGPMQDPFNAHRPIQYTEENDIAVQRRHPQAGSQILSASVPERGLADAPALFHQSADKTPRICTAVFG
jgi:hypothetical protein